MPAPILFAPNGQPLLTAAEQPAPSAVPTAEVQVGQLQLYQEHAPDGTPRMRISPIHPRHIPFAVAFLGAVDSGYVETTVRLRDDYGTRLTYKIIGFSPEHGLLVGELQDQRAPLRIIAGEADDDDPGDAPRRAQVDFDAS